MVLGLGAVPRTITNHGQHHTFAVIVHPRVMMELTEVDGHSWLNAKADWVTRLGSGAQTMSDAILKGLRESECIFQSERFLRARLHADSMRKFPAPGRLGHWMQRTGCPLWMSFAIQNARHLELRVRNALGMSLGTLKRMTRVKSTLLRSWTEQALERPVQWVAPAQEDRYADQSHMRRAVRPVTGFTPETLRRH